jgi:hypothetical protein
MNYQLERNVINVQMSTNVFTWYVLEVYGKIAFQGALIEFRATCIFWASRQGNRLLLSEGATPWRGRHKKWGSPTSIS